MADQPPKRVGNPFLKLPGTAPPPLPPAPPGPPSTLRQIAPDRAEELMRFYPSVPETPAAPPPPPRPGTGPLGPGGITPFELAQAYRDLHPQKFDDLDDNELIQAIKDIDPESYGLMDPLLEGADVLAPRHGTKPAPPPATPALIPPSPHVSGVVPTALRIVPAVVGAMGGSAVAPGVGTYLGGAGGAGLGETLAQYYEKTFGARDSMSPSVIALETALGAVNPGARGASTAARIASQAAYGAGLSGVGGEGRRLLEEGRFSSAPELGMDVGLGAFFGGATHGAAEAVGHTADRLSSAARTDYGLPDPTRPPPGPLDAYTAGVGVPGAPRPQGPPAPVNPILAAAARDQARQEFNQGMRKAVTNEAGRAVPELNRMVEARDYLARLAERELQPIPVDPTVGLGQPVPFGTPPQLQLPERSGASTILAHPPSLEEAQVDQLGLQPAPRVQAQHPLERELEASLQAPPGPPRLGGRVLRLTQPEVPDAPPIQPSLLARPRTAMEGPIEQAPILGGARPRPGQRQLPEVTTPRPLDREYAAGPNAGPRREGEAHGQPRSVRRQVRTGDKVSYEQVPSALPAEDPGTYPPEVRRELAAMAWELEQFPHERVQGGSTSGQLDALQAEGRDIAEAVGEARRRGATAGGAIPGAPVYHEVLAAAKGAFAHAKRAEMLRQIREALLEGRGTGLTDAAAEVARGRIRQREAGGKPQVGKDMYGQRVVTGHEIRAMRGDEGDTLIGWMDAEGNIAHPGEDLDEFARAAREASDGELLGAVKAGKSGEVSEEVWPYYVASAREAERRGLVDYGQPGLTMEGPGGAGGPSLFDFEGEPGPQRKPANSTGSEPPPAPTLPPGPTDTPLPGLEGVRDQNTQTPQMEVPFSLTAPPAPKPRGDRSRLRSLFEDEEGVLVFDVPNGDRAGLRRWLTRQEPVHGDEPWFSRVAQAIEDGNWDRAWKAAASASLRSTHQFRQRATAQQEAQLDQALRGTPLQRDINTQIVAGGREDRQGLHPLKLKGVGDEFPPAPTLSQAGAARGTAKIGPAGIINPGPPKKPLEPKYTDHLLGNSLMKSIIHQSDPGLLTLIPGNEDTNLRLYRQIADLSFQGVNTRELKQYLKLSDEEIAQHFLRSVQSAARLMQQLSAFRQVNAKTLDQLAHQMSMGGALRGMIGGEAATIVGRRGRVIGKVGAIEPERTLEALAESTRSFDQVMLTNALQKPRSTSEWDLIHSASYPFMLAKWATAVRNAVTGIGRYGVEALDEALTIPLETLLGTEHGAARARGVARERLSEVIRPGNRVTPRTSWKETSQQVYDITAETLSRMSPTDARQTLKLLQEFPSEEANFMGWAGGEDTPEGRSRFALVNSLIDPKVQRLLTVFNRAQEFTGRGMVFDAYMRGQLRARGHDPNVVLQLPAAQLATTLGGPQAMEDLIANSTAAALEATFASRAARDSIPGRLLRVVNDLPILKLGYPFPKFNLVAAPRFLWDHGPWALMDLVRFPIDALGAAEGHKGSRLYRGVRAQRLESQAIPELMGKRQAAQQRMSRAVRELTATRVETAVARRHVRALESRAQRGLPEVQTNLERAHERLSLLTRQQERHLGQVEEHKGAIRDLQSQEESLLDQVREAHGINAPNLPQYIARVGTGFGLLGAAFVVRSSDGAQGTKWYEYRFDREGKDPLIADFRPFAPFAQYLFVADVMQDFYHHTDWDKVRETASTLPEGTAPKLQHTATALTQPLDWTRAMWEHYSGKYTAQELGAQFGQAFLSISRAAGTTLTITDLLTANGWPSLQDAADAAIGTIGQFLSRFTVPGQMVSDVAATFDPEEAKARIPPKATIDEPLRPLAAPLANIPYVRQLIPEKLSQTTGKPVGTEAPLLRSVAGVGTSPRDFVTEEVRRLGVPGASVYIRETGDVGLDRSVAESYSRVLQQEMPAVLEAPEYQALRTPANKRDYLQRYIFPVLKRAALAEVRETLGQTQYDAATVTGEAARRKARQADLLSQLEEASGTAPADPEASAPEPSAPPSPAPISPF